MGGEVEEVGALVEDFFWGGGGLVSWLGGKGGGGGTGGFNLNVDARAEDLVPLVDGEDEGARVEGESAGERDGGVGEGGDAAEGVDEGRRGGEVAGDGVVLFRWGALGEGAEDVPDVFDCWSGGWVREC